MSDEREVAEIATELETLSLELMRRLDRRVEEAKRRSSRRRRIVRD